MKLYKNYLSEIKNADVIAAQSLNLATGDYGENELQAIIGLWQEVSSNSLDAEIVTDEDGTLYDYRVFDPYHKLGTDIYTDADGFSEWRNLYEDNQGNTINIIFADYNGETQDNI